MENKIVSIFNSSAEKYDIQRDKLIPMMKVFYDTAVEVVSIDREDGDILDLGTGTGIFAKWVMKKYPNAKYTLVDIADKMLDVARERFATLDNVTFQVNDYRKGIHGESYAAIISSMSIHHLDKEEKRQLYKNIYNSLKEGGVFVNADQVKGEDIESEEIVKDYQLTYIENCSLSRKEKDDTYDRIKLDKMDTMIDQINMLKEAGFKSVDIYYKYYNYIVFRCRK